MSFPVAGSEGYTAYRDALEARLETQAVMFVDMVGSTDIKTTQQFAYAMFVIREHHRMVEDALVALNEAAGGDEVGRIVKYIGDEVMLVFGAEHAPLAIRCALDVFNRLETLTKAHGGQIRSKVGIGFGKVAPLDTGARNPDPHGEPVDRAARLVAIAQPGQILVDSAYFERLEQEMVKPAYSVPAGELRKLKGFAQLERVYCVQRSGAPGRVLNFVQLRTEFKLIEEAATDLLLTIQDIGSEVDELLGGEGGRPSSSDVRKALDKVDRLNGDKRPFRVFCEVVASNPEAGESEGFAEHYRDVTDAYVRWYNGLKERRAGLQAADEDDRMQYWHACADEYNEFWRAVKQMQIFADQFVKFADGTRKTPPDAARA